uniref:Fucosyltransferase, N-terminal n=1 Tax=Candidatus Kentrum sp. DK TaxID=2126562 RepID=A0A450SSZ3_9GAMM|nr:MAG: Fucosyltransferase, N-terminal [Candidatus Kentron sp. DK]
MSLATQNPHIVLFHEYERHFGWYYINTLLPDDFRISTDMNDISRAVAVVFNLPACSGDTLRLLASKGRAPPNQLWVAFSIESEGNYPVLKMFDYSEVYRNIFSLWMTYRLDCDVPVTYLRLDAFGLLKRPVRPKPKGNLVCALVSSSSTRYNKNGRLEYIRELLNHIPVHSYGNYLNNRKIPDDRGVLSKMEIISRYKFTLAFENSNCRDYVTEKFFQPLVAGSVPVVMGAPNVEEFSPAEHCYIDVSNFGSPKELADYLKWLDQDDEAYSAYLDWKEKPLRASFMDRVSRYSVEMANYYLCERIRERLDL